MKVTFYNRDKRKGNFSIEELFNSIRSGIGSQIEITDYNFDLSRGRLKSIFHVRKFQGDLNHITGDVNFLAFGLNGAKTILTVHDIGHYENTLRGWKRIIYKFFWLKLPYRKVKYITTVSEFTKQNLINQLSINPEKIKVIYNPVSKIFKYSPKKFCADKPVILQIGSGRNKNISRLIEAVKGLKCQLLLINNLSPDLKSKLVEYKIDYINKSNISIEEVYQSYCNCDIVFFATEYEGFGLPIIEGNAVGRVVITSNITAMPEIAGDSAYFINPFSVEDIRNGICEIIQNEKLRGNLIRNGLENVKRFELKKICQDYLNLYQDITKS